MRQSRTVFFLCLGMACLLLVTAASAESDLLAPMKTRIEKMEAGLESTEDPVARVRLLLDTGAHDEAWALLPELRTRRDQDEALEAEFEVLMAVRDYERARVLVADRLTMDPAGQSTVVRKIGYLWGLVTDDLARLDGAVRDQYRKGDVRFPDCAARAELAALLMDYEAARLGYQEAMAAAETPWDLARAYRGLAVVAYRERDFDQSLAYLEQALPNAPPDADLLMVLANTLIRLGRTDESIQAAELAVRIAPYHERAHYLLGNGYARKNYTQLLVAYPDRFADTEGRKAMAAADELWAEGERDRARAAYRELRRQHPGWVDVLGRLGSMDWVEGHYFMARERFREALALCPEYGRAHNGLAKALEAQRLAIEVHRPLYEERFAALEFPQVAGIEEFVVNWHSLSPRHQKQVALSVAPWERYIPVLVESGSTYYIKPLHELLSETPGQAILRDQRISYDSRLWDDVRGCGGYHTVTGVEDVERTVLNRYNTVLHELTHQVHAVLTADRRREIQELYRRTKELDDAGEDAFLSRYAGGSVWEYFAEGANSLYSPRRDDFDTREIVLERLEERDQALKRLVIELVRDADVESCYAVGYVNRGQDRLEQGIPEEAIAAYRQALARSPHEETATSSLIYALLVAGRATEAMEEAETSAVRDPESAWLALRRAGALWHGGEGPSRALEVLESSRSKVREEERYLVDLEVGRLRWVTGDAGGAKGAYQKVLEYQSDNPAGLWGLASAHALAEEWDSAWTRYDEAVRVRTGVVALRTDYARDLLRAQKVEQAREQVEAALLLDPDDPVALAVEAWVLLAEGDADRALEKTELALERGPWCDLARIIQARVHGARGDQAAGEEAVAPVRERIEAEAPPSYTYRSKWGRYDEVHTLPAVERALLPAFEQQ